MSEAAPVTSNSLATAGEAALRGDVTTFFNACRDGLRTQDLFNNQPLLFLAIRMGYWPAAQVLLQAPGSEVDVRCPETGRTTFLFALEEAEQAVTDRAPRSVREFLLDVSYNIFRMGGTNPLSGGRSALLGVEFSSPLFMGLYGIGDLQGVDITTPDLVLRAYLDRRFDPITERVERELAFTYLESEAFWRAIIYLYNRDRSGDDPMSGGDDEDSPSVADIPPVLLPVFFFDACERLDADLFLELLHHPQASEVGTQRSPFTDLTLGQTLAQHREICTDGLPFLSRVIGPFLQLDPTIYAAFQATEDLRRLYADATEG